VIKVENEENIVVRSAKKFDFFFKNALTPLMTILISSFLFVGGWYLEIYTASMIGSAYWMIGLIGFYISYKSFKKSDYFSFLN